MIDLKDDGLILRFPELHDDAVCRIDLQRTLRLPDDNREHPLPPGLGRFPLEHIEDHSPRLPTAWAEHGGVLLPMYQAEALWINFSNGPGRGAHNAYPFAVKIAAGKINAVTGEQWSTALVKEPQDYLVLPDQPWLDGFCVQKGLIRQFVAMPLGQGYTAEEQLSGEAEHGGLQIVVYPMKRDRYDEILKQRADVVDAVFCQSPLDVNESVGMGLAPGGLMRQEIYEDEYGHDAWDLSLSSRCFVHILNSNQWEAATGKAVPGIAPTASDYANAGLPWFEYFDDTRGKLTGTKKLAGLDSVAAKGVKLGGKPLSENEPAMPNASVQLGPGSNKVSEEKW